MSQSIRRIRKRIAAGTVAGALGVAGVAVFAPQAGAAIQTPTTTTRVAGADRYATAAAIATTSFVTSGTVIVARGDDFPDALAANGLAGTLAVGGVPILLTTPTSVPAVTLTALTTLGATNVIIVGGTAAVSAAAATQLAAGGRTVTRISGADRVATAAAVATQIGAGAVGTVNGLRTAILVTGSNFADAVSVSPLAFAQKLPILISNLDAVPAPTLSAFTALGIQNVIIAGGTNVIGSAVDAQLAALGLPTTRLAGATRYDTSVAVANFERGIAPFAGDADAALARGDDFPDALAGGVHAGKNGAVILLTTPTALVAQARTFLAVNGATIDNLFVYGGTAAVSAATVGNAQAAAGLTSEAAFGAGTATVTLVYAGAGTFVGNVGGTDFEFEFDSNDAFQYQGVGITQAQFESVLSVGDVVAASYNPTPSGVSTFNITTDVAPAAIAAPTFAVVNLDAGATINDVTATFTPGANNSPGTTYALQTTTATSLGVDAACGGVGVNADVFGGTYTTASGATTTTNATTGAITFTLSNLANGCYALRVTATNPVTGVATLGTPSGSVTVPGPADVTAPFIIDTRGSVVAGLAGVLDAGDSFTMVASEVLGAPVAGDILRFTDADGTVVDLVNGTNATFTLNAAAQTVNSVSYVAGRVLNVAVTAAPTVITAGTVAGEQIASGALTDQAGTTDLANLPLSLATSTDLALA